MTPILQQHARRILVYGNKSSVFRSFGTLWSPEGNQTLGSRINSALDQKAQIIPVLDQWQQQENQVKPSDIRGLIKNLSDSSHFSQALEASKWMGEENVCTLFPKDYAAQLHLIEKVLGLEEAEKFFKSIPGNMRDYSVYSTLLSSYTRSEKTLNKVESTIKKMRELGFLLKPSPFNSMMSLYSQLGKRNMVNKLLYEMEENKVKPDNVTANIVLKAYAAVSDVNAMEMFMRTMRDVDEEGIKLKRDTIVAMAKAYVEVCLEGKAIEMYGDVAGSAGEVHTLWEVCKKKGKANEEEYRRVISSLLKLDDFEGAEKIYGEWRKKGHELELVKMKIILLNIVSMILLLAALIVPFYIFPLFVSIIMVIFICSFVSSF